MTQKTQSFDDCCTAFLVAAQALAAAALDRLPEAERAQCAMDGDAGAHLQVSAELPHLRLSVMLVNGDQARTVFAGVPEATSLAECFRTSITH
jgi:hypothetical protein